MNKGEKMMCESCVTCENRCKEEKFMYMMYLDGQYQGTVFSEEEIIPESTAFKVRYSDGALKAICV